MCRKCKCAYLRANGYCLMHKEACNVQNPDEKCSDGVVRALPSRERHFWKCLEEWDMNTPRGRLAFKTRKSRGHEVYRTCLRKRRFVDFNFAHKKALELTRKRDLDLFVYECPFCGGYHLTHKKPRYLVPVNDFYVNTMGVANAVEKSA